jgi:RNA polymerase sigma-70 factor (ECF subfamily)
MSDVDAALVTRTLNGERSAFEVLVASHLRRAQALARAVVRDESAVDDVVQEAFLRAYDKLGSLGTPAHFPSWLGAIVRNEAVTWLRRNARPTESLEHVAAPSPEAVEPDPRLGQLRAALDRLPPAYREIIALKYEAGLDYQQIAETLGISEANVEKRLYRARQALLAALPVRPE